MKVELLECIDPKDDQAMSERIRARRNEIARVLPGDESGHSLAHLLERLESVRCQKATSIKIRYHLQAFNRAWLSREELVPALFLPHQDALLFTWADNREPWAAIARELAIALYPEEDPGRLAAGLKEAIAPASADEASAILDELGFARLDITGAPANMTSKTASSLGAEGPIEIGPPPMGTSELVTEGPDVFTPQEAVERLLGKNAPRPTPCAPELDITERQTSVGAHSEGSGTSRESSAHIAGGEASGSRGSKTGPRHTATNKRTPGPPGSRPFISYIAAHPDEEEPDLDGLDQQARMELAEKAIALILTLESRLQRTHTHNPGFDLFEAGQNGQPIRWIEVKAMRGELRDRPVGLSRTQFEYAQKHGEAYWLYVVEYAGDEKRARIVCIQNPAGKARTFTFDHGWLAVAERVGGNASPVD